MEIEALSDAVLQFVTANKWAALTRDRKRSKLGSGGIGAMPAFAKNPKFIVGTIVVLWVAYVIYSNFQLDPIKVHLLPFAATLDLRVSAVIIGAAIFGSISTLVVQWLWKRRSSKKAAESATASPVRASTVA
jgi:hypothetical protein